MSWQDAVVATLAAAAGDRASAGAPAQWRRSGGSTFGSVWSLGIGSQRYFVKRSDAEGAHMLEAEADGLRALQQARAVRVPRVFAYGSAADGAWLALEWLEIAAGGRDARLGRALARLHANTAPRFGWHRDNTIGATPQPNGWSDDWAAFFRDRRLAPQLDLAARHGHASLCRRAAPLLASMGAVLAGHTPRASLLHGDLWSGNAGALADGTPVVYDPAAYYGDREADLAMTHLFGGFAPDFHAAYLEAAPLPPGHERRRTLYNLYHVLNHLNLFGAAYLRQAESMVGELVAAIG